MDDMADVEFKTDFEAALSYLTRIQRISFIEVRLKKRTQADVATEWGTSRENVKQAIHGAVKKWSKYYS